MPHVPFASLLSRLSMVYVARNPARMPEASVLGIESAAVNVETWHSNAASETTLSLQSPQASSPSSLLRPYMKWRPTAVLGTLVTLGSFVAAAWLLANPTSVVRTEASVPEGEIEMGGVMIFDVKAYFLSSLYGSMDSLGRAFAALHDDLSIETNLIMTDYVYTINPQYSLEHNATLYTWWMVRRVDLASANETRSRLLATSLKQLSRQIGEGMIALSRPWPAQNFLGTIYQNWCIDGKFQFPKAEERAQIRESWAPGWWIMRRPGCDLGLGF